MEFSHSIRRLSQLNHASRINGRERVNESMATVTRLEWATANARESGGMVRISTTRNHNGTSSFPLLPSFLQKEFLARRRKLWRWRMITMRGEKVDKERERETNLLRRNERVCGNISIWIFKKTNVIQKFATWWYYNHPSRRVSKASRDTNEFRVSREGPFSPNRSSIDAASIEIIQDGCENCV